MKFFDKIYKLINDSNEQEEQLERLSAEKAPEWVVVAGDPSHGYMKRYQKFAISDDKKGNLVQLVIEGNSMSPRGIEHGCNVLCSPVKGFDSLKDGDFIVVGVDENYYKPGDEPIYQKKLRRYVCTFSPGTAVNDMIILLRNMNHDEIILQRNREKLHNKLQKAQDYYGKDAELSLSMTFRNGVLEYSFHLPNKIEFKVESVVYPNNESKLVEVKDIPYNRD